MNRIEERRPSKGNFAQVTQVPIDEYSTIRFTLDEGDMDHIDVSVSKNYADGKYRLILRGSVLIDVRHESIEWLHDPGPSDRRELHRGDP